MANVNHLYNYRPFDMFRRGLQPVHLTPFQQAIVKSGLNSKVSKVALASITLGLFYLALKRSSHLLAAGSIGSGVFYLKVKPIPDFQKPKVVNSLAQLEMCDLSEVEEINLSHSRIQFLPPKFDLPKLKKLNLNSSAIRSLPNKFNPPNLEYFDIRNTAIKQIPVRFNPPKLEVMLSSVSSAARSNFSPQERSEMRAIKEMIWASEQGHIEEID